MHIAEQSSAAFETSLHYGHSIARVKVQQGLAILGEQGPTATATTVSDLKSDVVAHMKIPFYQGVIHSAWEMDTAPTAAAKAVAQETGRKYLEVFHTDLPANDQALLVALFAAANAPTGDFHFCAASTILARNMPSASMHVYHNENAIHEVKEEVVHMTAADLGSLKVSLVDNGVPKDCASPPSHPPRPPPSPPPSPSSPVAIEEDTSALSEEGSSGLTDGEIVGIAIGAVVGALILIALIALIVRSKTSQKPVFTCLEKQHPVEKVDKKAAQPTPQA